MWDGEDWFILPVPIETIEEAVFGWLATDDEKRATLLKLVNDFMDGAARAAGFVSILDASASAPANPTNRI